MRSLPLWGGWSFEGWTFLPSIMPLVEGEGEKIILRWIYVINLSLKSKDFLF